jgi:hypothetical protein
VRRCHQDEGTVAPLVAAYLAFIVLVILLSSNVVSAMAYSHRLQGVTDAAVVYGHDRSLTVGQPKLDALRSSITTFLQTAPSAKRLNLVVVNVSVSGERSELELCAQLDYPLSLGSGVVCRRAVAQSYLLP